MNYAWTRADQVKIGMTVYEPIADKGLVWIEPAGDLWELYYEGVRIGRVWSEVCEDIGLPVRKDW